MSGNFRMFRAALWAAALVMGTSATARAGVLSDFNLIALGDVTGTSEVEGRSLVFGDVVGSAKNFAILPAAVASSPTTPGVGAGDALVVGGQVLATSNVNHGGVRVRGADGGAAINNADFVTFNDAGVDAVLTRAAAEISQADAYFAGLTADSSVDLSDFNQAIFTSTPGADGVAVFDIDASFFGRNGTFDLRGDTSADLFVIRVGGSTSLTSGNALNVFANEFGQDAFQSRIVWDFSALTGQLNLVNGLGGSVFAPGADLTFGSPLEGTVVARNVNLASEVHLPTSVVPEPAAGLVAFTTAAPLLLRRRRGAAVN